MNETLHISFYGGPWDGGCEEIEIEENDIPSRVWVPARYHPATICTHAELAAKRVPENHPVIHSYDFVRVRDEEIYYRHESAMIVEPIPRQ